MKQEELSAGFGYFQERIKTSSLEELISEREGLKILKRYHSDYSVRLKIISARIMELKKIVKPTYTLYWFNGNREVITGANANVAFRRAGYSDDDLAGLSFWIEGNNNDFIWDDKKHKWIENS